MNFFNLHTHFKGQQDSIYNLLPFEDNYDSSFSVGIHPKDINQNVNDLLFWVNKKAKEPNCLAIGECGLDSFANASTEAQEDIFMKHISIANEINKPIIVHCVRKYYQLFKFKKNAKVPMIVHGFNRKNDLATSLIEQDFILSFGKALLYRVSLQELVTNLPIERFFLENDDANFNIEELYSLVASLKKISIETLSTQINENKKLIFHG